MKANDCINELNALIKEWIGQKEHCAARKGMSLSSYFEGMAYAYEDCIDSLTNKIKEWENEQ
jgi:hypothetical protein